jgi:hypothetical protein
LRADRHPPGRIADCAAARKLAMAICRPPPFAPDPARSVVDKKFLPWSYMENSRSHLSSRVHTSQARCNMLILLNILNLTRVSIQTVSLDLGRTIG